MKIASRLALGTIGILGIAGLALGAAGAAHAGTMPIVRPGEPTVAMTITNHTNQPEHLIGSSAAGGEWVNAPAKVLYPGASQTITATAPLSGGLDVNAMYRIGDDGPIARYQVNNHRAGTNTAMTGISGRHAQRYWINSKIDTGFPQANVRFDQW
ncbi:hypothetical protein [Gordonia paraffinivorans]|uniref:hypothetical protein n=1 Tax=Gordonia paraffinivorans TaxID=175628 RepID=UPI001446A810|nr:hypothetical protein [Gordonia paraffinivorans]MCD2147167.1 hypothetical protein [Gordonia paraffinivorans]